MNRPVAATPQALLVCSLCKEGLRTSDHMLCCTACRAEYPRLSDGIVDMMPPGWSEERAADWASRQHEMEAWYRGLIADTALAVQCFENDYRPFEPSLATLAGSILDIGGGNGVARHFLPTGVGYTVIDPSLDWLGAEWHALGGSYPCLEDRPSFVRGVGEHLPFPAASFDHALSFWSLNHARHPERVLHEAARVLRPGGRLLLVLEDMAPRWLDLPRLFGVHRDPEARRALVRAKLLCSLGVREWPIQDDHVRIRERDLRGWITGRFRVARRAWIGQYLTYELCRDDADGGVPTRQDVTGTSGQRQ
jgi:SAM-dependent methyltransferase